MKIMKIKIYCVHWEKADENPIDQESWKNLISERILQISPLTACVHLLSSIVESYVTLIRDMILPLQLSPSRVQSRMGHYAEKRG